ncbi:MAG: hypothetical protein JXA37_07890 [Chloroflexia bacterium]|nr:hypothetical protein [Chloroflexia bacterium]
MKAHPHYRRLSRRITVITTVANLFGAFLVMSYLRSTLRQSTPLGLDLGVLLLVSAGLMVLGNYLIERRQAPLWTWYRRALDGQVAAPAPQTVRRMALNMPGNSALATLAMWLLAGLIFGFTNGLESGGGLNWDRAAQTVLAIVGLAGPVTVIIIYFARAHLAGRTAPLFRPGHAGPRAGLSHDRAPTPAGPLCPGLYATARPGPDLVQPGHPHRRGP